MDDDALHEAFECVYLDLCAHGLCRFDPQILAELWAAFVSDMARGFPSLFANERRPAAH